MMNHSRRVQYLIAVSVSAAALVMGCYSTWAAPVMTKFHDNETNIVITNDEISWMVSMSAPGFMTGSLIMRHVADRFGRRATVLGSAVPAALGTIIIDFATTPWLLYVTKFIWGCGVGMISVSSLYFAEISDKEIRGTLTLSVRFMFNFGNLLMMAVGPFVSYINLNYMMLGLPICFFAANWWIPESPYFYLKEGKVESARKSLRLIRGYEDEKDLEEELSEMQSQVKNEMRHSSTMKELFIGKQYRKAIVVVIGLKITQMLSGQMVIVQYLGVIMKESQSTMELSTAFIVFGAVRFIVAVLSSILSDKVGRRELLIYSYLGTGISTLIVGIYFFLLDIIKIDPECLRPYSFFTFAAIIVSCIVSTLGFFSVINIIPAEIFPINVRATAFTALCILGGFLSFLVTRSYQIIKDLTGLSGVFWLFSAASLSGALFSFIYVPETRGKSLKDIQIQLQGDLYEAEEVVKLNQVIDVKERDVVGVQELKVLNS